LDICTSWALRCRRRIVLRSCWPLYCRSWIRSYIEEKCLNTVSVFWQKMSRMTRSSVAITFITLEDPRSPNPKEAKSRGEHPLLITPPKVLLQSTNSLELTMSVALPFRQFPSPSLGSWTCAACTRSLTRIPRARNPAFTARRCLNTTKPARSSTAPRMDQMAAQYKIKNRTVMYEQSVPRRSASADN
jgi:hypothetical protein